MKIICTGRNYSEHAKELGNEIPEDPVIFMKPDTAVLKKGSDFYIPEFSDDVHYELEVVLKISKGGKYIQKENMDSDCCFGVNINSHDFYGMASRISNSSWFFERFICTHHHVANSIARRNRHVYKFGSVY